MAIDMAISVKFYWNNPGWTVVLYQDVLDGGQVCIWDGRYPTYGEAMLRSADALKQHFPDALKIDRAPTARVLKS